MGLSDFVAEDQGFEPWKGINPCRFSRPVHSTALPTLREGGEFSRKPRVLSSNLAENGRCVANSASVVFLIKILFSEADVKYEFMLN
jgi:hypothetical protein